MKTYLFSIFVRFFLAFSGFLVFVLTAYLYGAEGRGVIGYATSLYAVFGHLFSMNLDRGFLAETNQADDKKHELLKSFLLLNFVMGILASAGGWIYWYFSPTGHEMLTQYQVTLFAFTSVFHIWTANGNFFFSSFLKTTLQEMVILSVRVILIVFLAILALTKNQNIDLFITWYSIILFLGVLTENIFLLKICRKDLQQKFHFPQLITILKKTFVHHIDYLAFNIFPLVLTVICASYITKADVGRVNFAIQIVNMVFLFAMTANIRISAYVSDTGFRARISQYKKLFVFTAAMSVVSSVITYFGLRICLYHFHFQQFEGVENLFVISALAVPGYIIYQFLNPIWIELKKEKLMASLHSLNFLACLALSPFILKKYEAIGVMYIFVIFHCGVLIIQAAVATKTLTDSCFKTISKNQKR